VAVEHRVTELLLAAQNGNQEAVTDLFPLVYDELRTMARRKLRHERSGHTLDTTALVHEAYLKLVHLDPTQWQSRAHFLAVAARAMRNILVNHALRRKRLKRGGGAVHVQIEGTGHAAQEDAAHLPSVEADRILALDSALEKLATMNQRHARVVECRFFGGMTIEETALVLKISPATVKRDWTLLRAWLGRELAGAG
jgi:RNA polymerase sigma factor (TIGR02999 family)